MHRLRVVACFAPVLCCVDVVPAGVGCRLVRMEEVAQVGGGAAIAIPVAPIQLARVPVGEAVASRAHQSRSHAAAAVLELSTRLAEWWIKRVPKPSAVDSFIAGVGLAVSFAILGVSSKSCIIIGPTSPKPVC